VSTTELELVVLHTRSNAHPGEDGKGEVVREDNQQLLVDVA
jgi:hypothetical protein